jgi:hypothetical protein
VIEAVDALDDLRADSSRESRFGTNLDKAPARASTFADAAL